MSYALHGQTMQAKDGDKGHFSVFRLRHTLGSFSIESPSLPVVVGTMLPPSPSSTVGAGSSASPECNMPFQQQVGKATLLSNCGPEVEASQPLPAFPCGLEDISPDWKDDSVVKRDSYIVVKIKVWISASIQEVMYLAWACNLCSKWGGYRIIGAAV